MDDYWYLAPSTRSLFFLFSPSSACWHTSCYSPADSIPLPPIWKLLGMHNVPIPYLYLISSCSRVLSYFLYSYRYPLIIPAPAPAPPRTVGRQCPGMVWYSWSPLYLCCSSNFLLSLRANLLHFVLLVATNPCPAPCWTYWTTPLLISGYGIYGRCSDSALISDKSFRPFEKPQRRWNLSVYAGCIVHFCCILHLPVEI